MTLELGSRIKELLRATNTEPVVDYKAKDGSNIEVFREKGKRFSRRYQVGVMTLTPDGGVAFDIKKYRTEKGAISKAKERQGK